MLMNDLLIKKRDGGELSQEEISFMIEGYTKGDIPDYQMSAMLMAIYFQGMTGAETLSLTMAMVDSGDRIDLSGIEGVKADKHSTGGVGDKTSLVLCPLVAACGVKMAKMSGRGLGHTGGTIDKLESFPGLSCDLEMERFIEIVNTVGFAIAGQTANLTPADKKIYALRDVTGTVPSTPLIVSSIMSKKLASGSDVIVLDVKMGSGAFMKTEKDAKDVATKMVEVGKLAGKRCVAVITDMDEPLGYAVGNALEVKEAINVLSGKDAGGLLDLCLVLGANILVESGRANSSDEARELMQKTIDDGSALAKLADFVEAQGGDREAVYDVSRLPQAGILLEAPAPRSGYVKAIDAAAVGGVELHLGGARKTKESVVDLSVGVVLHKKKGDLVNAGDSLGTIHANDMELAKRAAEMLADCYEFSSSEPEKTAFIKEIIR